jgi:hypothetical protein
MRADELPREILLTLFVEEAAALDGIGRDPPMYLGKGAVLIGVVAYERPTT